MKKSENKIDVGGVVIVSILSMIGILILYSSGLTKLTNNQELIEYLKENIILIMFSLFFIFAGIYGWITFIKKEISKSKRKTVYLLEIETTTCTFIDKKGKKYYYPNENYCEIFNFYDVKKTKDSILEVYGKSTNSFSLNKIYTGYWLNFYTPKGSWENIFILPIIYILLIPLLYNVLFNHIVIGIICACLSFPIIFLIVYDAMYKIQLFKGKDNVLEKEKKESVNFDMKNIMGIVVGLAGTASLTYCIIFADDTFSRFVFALFGLQFLFIMIFNILKIYNFNTFKIKKIKFTEINIVRIILIVACIGFFGKMMYEAILNNDSPTFLVLIPFLVVLLFALYKIFKKK